MIIRISLFVRNYWLARRGSVAIQIALMLTLIVGMGALGTEITYILYKHRQMQSAADSSALGAGIALATGRPADPVLEARAIAASLGFVHGADGTAVIVNRPPLSGSNTGNASAIEVVVSQPQFLSMVSLFQTLVGGADNGLFNVGAHAVAIQGNSSLYCMLALDPSATSAIRIQNNARVTSPDCGVAVNSNSDTALVLRNNAAIDGPVSVHGNWSLGNNAQLNGHPLVNHGPVIADPYADVQLQSIPSCTSQSGSGGNNTTINLNPGHFCSGWNFQNNVKLNLAPGAYYIDQRLTFGSNIVVNGTGGVTLIINGNYSLSITNNASVNVTAPSSGAYAGLAFFGRRDATANVTQRFANNTTLNITGVIYFPNQIIQFDNNGSTVPGGCTQVIGRIIRVNNNVGLDKNCIGTGVKPIGSTLTQLVE
jgi:hypothetical protein